MGSQMSKGQQEPKKNQAGRTPSSAAMLPGNGREWEEGAPPPPYRELEEDEYM
ncbi:MAG: hypothetical protein M1829_006151 [Trizodia sp. TS-e1964]|nr:MAG: hypothetical protein M1829_006151 [Trizodia sp. TS-e1964]